MVRPNPLVPPPLSEKTPKFKYSPRGRRNQLIQDDFYSRIGDYYIRGYNKSPIYIGDL